MKNFEPAPPSATLSLKVTHIALRFTFAVIHERYLRDIERSVLIESELYYSFALTLPLVHYAFALLCFALPVTLVCVYSCISMSYSGTSQASVTSFCRTCIGPRREAFWNLKIPSINRPLLTLNRILDDQPHENIIVGRRCATTSGENIVLSRIAPSLLTLRLRCTAVKTVTAL